MQTVHIIPWYVLDDNSAYENQPLLDFSNHAAFSRKQIRKTCVKGMSMRKRWKRACLIIYSLYVDYERMLFFFFFTLPLSSACCNQTKIILKTSSSWLKSSPMKQTFVLKIVWHCAKACPVHSWTDRIDCSPPTFNSLTYTRF